MTDVRRAVDAVFKLEAARLVAGLTRLVRDVGLAEELAQDALVAAMEQWPGSGVPDNPGAWLMAVAKRRAVDHIRRAETLDRKRAELAREVREEDAAQDKDDVLRLMFLSCHPVLPTPARVALTLRLLGGLTAAEIARAFLVTEAVITRRIAEAKRALAEVPFDLPEPDAMAARLSSVLEAVYLIFNEGYSATSGDDLQRPALCQEALRLGRLLAELAPQESEVHGLVALMEIQASRTAARTGPDGEPVQLHEQNRGRWDRLLIHRGFTAMLRARQIGGPPGPYVLQAAIAVCHAQARSADDTDWPRIAALYAALVRVLPTAVVRLNQAVAVGMAHGPEAGLALTDAISLPDYHLLPAVRGDLLLRLGRETQARLEFERAANLTTNAAERAFLLRRADAIVPTPTTRTLGQACADFLAREDLGPSTIRSYAQTLRRLCRSLGDNKPLDATTATDIATVFNSTWDKAAPKTWNRHLSAVRTFAKWSSLDSLDGELERRPETSEPAKPAPLQGIWELPDVPLREQTLWRLLHESEAKVTTVLAINIEHLDLADRRARVRGTWVTWRSGTAALLPALVADRPSGPLFLSDRRPGPARTPSPDDLCPHTGRRRLSYERAEYLFKQATRALDPDGYTLRGLRTG
ncbi:sigma factor [Actinokineospora auranticolor]|uniref:RNA polymerase sigma factor n=1 Tax=Actinokineospora auranticolor TaxID=155976 RepID=A0A2S6GWV7_9PSEU|nr:DUF6596 domain-containing protein [Actinokineospora auranticolor]PPK69676.1 RNA polymerase sigma factor (sigma-70 family) [Actinokineospora auranticolor]